MADAFDDVHTFWELLCHRAEASGDAAAFVDGGDRRVTFGELRERAERVAAGFYDLGVRPGTPVTWQLPTRIETVVASMALARLGAVQNPIIPIYREREVAFVLRQTRPRVFLIPGTWRDYDYGAMASAICADMDDPPTVIEAYDSLPEGDPTQLPAPPTDGDTVRWVYYTSGTTSDPKGVRHTDNTLIAGGRGLAVALDMRSTDVGSIAFPFTHIAGPDYLVMMLLSGFSAVLVERFVPTEALEVYRRHGVTMAGGSAAFYTMFLTEQRKQPETHVLPSLRILSGGGSPKPPEVYYEVQRELGVTVCNGYGMTEVPMIVQGSPHDTDEQLAYTEGVPVLGAEVRIVADDGSVAPAGADGEVRVRGPIICKGYTDPELTDEAFDADGFFRTGDIGHLRADGHMVLTGRLKDVIIRKGENISAKELEDLLYQHPKVREVAVVGLRDRERGERVCAVVTPEGEDQVLTLGEVTDHLSDAGIMRQKLPEQLEIVDELPRNAMGKVVKFKLQRQFADNA